MRAAPARQVGSCWRICIADTLQQICYLAARLVVASKMTICFYPVPSFYLLVGLGLKFLDSRSQQSITHTHSHFTALLEFVRYHPGEQVPER